jgi:ParB/RepB/Spo0J family partition protein
MKLKLSEIVVKESRYRKDFGDIQELALSINKIGLLHPIVVTKDKVLVAGERRLRAHQELGMDEIEVKFLDECTEVVQREIEIEENIKRKAFTWQEEVLAKEELNKIKQDMYGASIKGHGGGWGLKQTAEAIGVSTGTISRDLQIAKAIRDNPELAKLKSKEEVFKQMLRQREKELVLQKGGMIKLSVNKDCIVHGNSKFEMEKLQAESVDLICTDPPFAIGFDKMNFSGGCWDGKIYQDDPNHVFDELHQVMKQSFRVLKQNRHAYFFFGIQHYAVVQKLLIDVGFKVSEVPLIWHKKAGSGSGGGDQQYASNYEACFFCQKGSRKLNTLGKSNVLEYDRVASVRKIHAAEKPKALLRFLIEESTEPGELVVDPYAGSGSTLLAAIECKRRCWGCEKDDEHYGDILIRLEELEKEINNVYVKPTSVSKSNKPSTSGTEEVAVD